MSKDPPKETPMLAVSSKKSILREQSLSSAVQLEYDIRQPFRISLFRISGSDVYRLITANKLYFMKVYKHGIEQDRRAIASAKVLMILEEHGFCAPRLLLTRKNSPLIDIMAPEGYRKAYIYEAVIGWEPVESNAEDSKEFGYTTGKLHNLMDSVPNDNEFAQLDYDRLFGRYITLIANSLPNCQSEIAFLKELSGKLWESLRTVLCTCTPQWGFCHGDLHTGNAIRSSSADVWLFDFDACCYGWRVLDIGTYYVSYDWTGLNDAVREERRRIVANFLEGYSRTRTITSQELEVLDLFLAIRHYELLGLCALRVPVEGDHWVTEDELRKDVSWFRKWIDYSNWPKGKALL